VRSTGVRGGNEMSEQRQKFAGLDAALRTTVYRECRADPTQQVIGIFAGKRDGPGRVKVAGALTVETGSNLDSRSVLGAWPELEAFVARSFPDAEPVGWYYGRPGGQARLQHRDVELHQQLFGDPWNFVFCLDPVSGERAMHGWHDGQLGVIVKPPTAGNAQERRPHVRPPTRRAVAPSLGLEPESGYVGGLIRVTDNGLPSVVSVISIGVIAFAVTIIIWALLS
jgi:hypothetical protein